MAENQDPQGNTSKEELEARLLQCCREGRETELKDLLSRDVNVNCTDENGRSPLILSVIGGHMNIVKAVLEQCLSVYIEDDCGMNALMYAELNRSDDIAEMLEECGAYHRGDRSWKKSLVKACRLGRMALVEQLVQRHIKDDDREAKMDLIYACVKSDFNAVQSHLEQSIGVNGVQVFGLTALMFSIISGSESIVVSLLQHGALVDAVDIDGTSALMHACKYDDHGKKFNSLMSYNADVNLRNADGETALAIACQFGTVEMVELLLKHGAVVDARDKKKKVSLDHACERGDKAIVETLIQFDADVNDTKVRDTALLIACGKGHVDIVRLLFEHGADLNLTGNKKALVIASRYGHEQIARFLIDHGIGVNECDLEWDTALMHASKYGHINIVQLLLEHGADVNQRSQLGDTALLKACNQGHDKIAELLIERGSDVNLVDNDGYTALKSACMFGHSNVVKLLIKNGADVNNVRDKTGMTPLMWASSSESCVNLLLQNRAQIDIQDNDGRTAAMYAVQYDNYPAFEKLFRAGVNLDLTDNEGQTIFSYAIGNKTSYCLRTLLVEDILLQGGRLKSAHKNSKFSFNHLEPLMVTMALGIFEWEWLPLRHLESATLAALDAGLCPGKIQYSSSLSLSPLIVSFIEDETELTETLIKRRYFYPEDYITLSTDHSIRERVTNASLLDDFTLQPLSLQTWSFLIVSKSISLPDHPGLRRHRVDGLNLPEPLKRTLWFCSN